MTPEQDAALTASDQALRQAPHRADLHQRHGQLLLQFGRPEQAAASFARAAALQPALVEAHFLTGAAWHAAGRPDLALPAYQQALDLRPDLAEAQLNRGAALRALGRHAEALASYDRVVALRPDWADPALNRANLLKDLGRTDEARREYDRVIALAPDNAQAYANRGALAEAEGAAAPALADYERAVTLAPGLAMAWFGRGNVLTLLSRPEAAVESYDRALALCQDWADAWLNRGHALEQGGQTEAALSCYQSALALRPGWPQALANRGSALYALERFEAALAAFDQAIAAAPDQADFYYNRGLVHYAQGALTTAVADYDRALALRPDYGEAGLNRAISLLSAGDLGRGWEAFEWRWRIEPQASRARPPFPPRWNGETPLSGRRILIYSEQGYGDTLQMCRYVPRLAAQGARVVLEVEAELTSLLAGLDGVAAVVAKGDPLPPFDCHCPVLSLPRAFGTTLDTIPAPPAYLAADPARVAAWLQRLGPASGLRVGLAWSGNPAHRNDQQRSLTLALLAPLLDGRIDAVALQKEIRPADRPILATLPGLRHFGDVVRDFADTAALCALCDLVISVDTSVAHLAGALGRPTWILLPAKSCDWRWLTDRADSPWYPTATLYRQQRGEAWAAVIERVGAALDLMLSRSPA